MSQAEQQQHPNVALASLNLAHIHVMYAYTRGEFPLGHPPLLSVLTNVKGKTL